MNNSFWKKGSGTFLYGVLLLSVGMFMCYYIYAIFLSQYSATVAQTRSDIIADAAAITLSGGDNKEITEEEVENARLVAKELLNLNQKYLSDEFTLSQSLSINTETRIVTNKMVCTTTALNFASQRRADFIRYSAVEVIDMSKNQIILNEGVYPDNPFMECLPQMVKGENELNNVLYLYCATQFPTDSPRYTSYSYNNDVILLRDILKALDIDCEIPLQEKGSISVGGQQIEFSKPIEDYTDILLSVIENEEFGLEETITAYQHKDSYKITDITSDFIEVAAESANKGHVTVMLLSDGRIYIILPTSEEYLQNDILRYICLKNKVKEGYISKQALKSQVKADEDGYLILVSFA